MQRARRLASVAVAAALTVGGLSACRSEPSVAVYLGAAGKISVAEVQRVYDDAKTKLTDAQQQAAAKQPGAELKPIVVPISTPDVVSALIGREVITRLAKERNIPVPAQLPLDEAAQSLGLPPSAEYVKLFAESRLLLNQLLQQAPASNPPEADVRHVFEVFEKTGQMKPGLKYEEFKSGVSPEALQTLGRALAVKQQVRDQLSKLNYRVNPRYEGSEIPVYTESGPDNKPLVLVAVPLADPDSAPVVDAA